MSAAISLRQITIRCPFCHYDIGTFNADNTATCVRCARKSSLDPVRLAQLTPSARRRTPSRFDEKGEPKPAKFLAGGQGLNTYQQNPRALQYPRFNMRLSEQTFNQLNALIEAWDMTGADVIRKLVADAYFVETEIEGGRECRNES